MSNNFSTALGRSTENGLVQQPVRAGTIVAWMASFAAWAAGNITFNLRVNGATVATSTVAGGAGAIRFANLGLSLPVAANDVISVELVCDAAAGVTTDVIAYVSLK